MLTIKIIENSKNTIDVKLYNLDSTLIFLNKIYSELNTLDKYVYFTDYEKGVFQQKDMDDLYDGKIINIINVLTIIESYTENDTNFSNLLENKYIKEVIDNYDNNKNKYIKDVLIPTWISYRKDVINQNPNMRPFLSLIYYEQLKDYYNDEHYFNDLFEFIYNTSKKDINELLVSKIKNLKPIITYNINIIKQNLEYTEKINKNLEKTKEYKHTKFNTEYTTKIFYINIDSLSHLDIFDTIKLNNSIPFASYKSYYKILENFQTNIIPENNNDDYIKLMLSTKNDNNIDNFEIISINKVDDFLQFELTFKKDNDEKEEDINEEKEEKEEKVNDNEEPYFLYFINKITNIFQDIDMKLENSELKLLGGEYYYPNFKLNKYIFLDLLMNDDNFSYIKVDESRKATKLKNNIHIYFLSDYGNITAELTPNIIVDKLDELLKKYKNDGFQVGKEYLRIRLNKVPSIKVLNIFVKYMSKLLSLYTKNFDNIEREYRKFIPDFNTESKKKKEEKEEKEEKEVMDKLKYQLPNIFMSGYSRLCTDKRQPSIAKEDEVTDLVNKGYKIMTFPKENSPDQRIYYCKNKKYRYPGLINNTNLDNKNIYPVIPCCFSEDQSIGGRRKDIYKQYFSENKDYEYSDKKSFIIIKTGKILGKNSYGMLPTELEKYFNITTINTDYTYVRLGVSNIDNNSFLIAIMKALNPQYIETNIKEERKIIGNDILNSILCKQELYNQDITDIQKHILNMNEYFNPIFFLRILEEQYKINIFIFDKNGLIIPPHKEGYYKYNNYENSIYIYQNIGTERDIKVPHPQCELIVRIRKDEPNFKPNNIKNIKFMFSSELQISKQIKSTFNIINKFYILNKEISFTNNIFQEYNLNILRQNIDIYGKCRRIDILFENKELSLYTSPLPPFKVPIIDIFDDIKYTDLITTAKFIKKLNLNIEYQVCCNEKNILELHLYKNQSNLTLKLQIEHNNLLPNIKIEKTGFIFNNFENQSKLTNFINNKKIANYLIDYVYWLYSNYMYKKYNSDTYIMSPESITDFFEENTIIDSNFSYNKKDITKTFSTNSGFFKNNKLVLESEEMQKRLVFLLLVGSVRPFIPSYRKLNNIPNYYQDINDFKQYNGQLILYGDDSLYKWMEEKQKYIMHNSISIGKITPYFFNFKNKIYLAQNTDHIEKAINIARIWFEEGYNIGIHSEPKDIDENVQISLYIITKNGLTHKKTKGKITQYSDTSVIYYLVNKKKQYTVLLPI